MRGHATRALAAAVGGALGSIAAWSNLEALPCAPEWRKSELFEAGQVVVPKGPPEHVTATFYCGCPVCCGKWSTPEAITASGVPAVEGLTIAADWRVFPKGTCLVLQGFGRRIVHDTGSAIKGARIDVYLEDHDEALELGVKKLKVKLC